MNFTDEQIEYIKNASNHVNILCGGRGQGKIHQLINEMQDKINNLQSKIDKANQYLEERFIFDDENGEYYQTHTFDKSNAKELHDILKEDKQCQN